MLFSYCRQIYYLPLQVPRLMSIISFRHFFGFSQKHLFSESRWSVIYNPHYIIRSALLRAIKHYSVVLSGSILDIGCGSKPYEFCFKNSTSYFGIDVLATGHDHSETSADLYFDGKEIPFPESSFDNIVCFEVIEHVFSLSSLLSQIFTILRPNGYFLITIPFGWDEHEQPFDYARYTSFGIIHLLESAVTRRSIRFQYTCADKERRYLRRRFFPEEISKIRDLNKSSYE